MALETVAGTVVKWIAQKGYGFIEDPTRKVHMVNVCDLIVSEGVRSLQSGEKVTFDAEKQSDGRSRARNVRVLPNEVNHFDSFATSPPPTEGNAEWRNVITIRPFSTVSPDEVRYAVRAEDLKW